MNNQRHVVTTVNPFGNLDNQLACFNSWKRAGYSIKSYNAKKEADILTAKGFSEADIIVIPDEQTTHAVNGKYLPKVRPIIEAAQLANTDVIVTNSDIYALHRIPLIQVFNSIAPSLAFTRREVLSLSNVDIRDNEFYRGGLDLFFVSAAALSKLVKELNHCEAANEMAFGVPGWDYLMGALIETKLKGKLCDGPIVAHKYHKNTYSALNNFSPYARGIAKLLGLNNTESYFVAEHYSQRIVEQCRAQAKIRTQLQTFFHLNDVRQVNDDLVASHINLTDVDDTLQNANHKRLRTVLAAVEQEKDWGLANQFIAGCFVRTPELTANLFTLWNFLLTREQAGKHYSVEYPKGYLHGVVIKNCLALPEAQQANALFGVFATELVNHNIFNKYLFNYMVWSATNKKQLKILECIKKCIGDA